MTMSHPGVLSEAMDDITIIPNHIGVGTTSHDGKQLGLLVVSGSTVDGAVKANIVVDQPTLGSLVASLESLRSQMVKAGLSGG